MNVYAMIWLMKFCCNFENIQISLYPKTFSLNNRRKRQKRTWTEFSKNTQAHACRNTTHKHTHTCTHTCKHSNTHIHICTQTQKTCHYQTLLLQNTQPHNKTNSEGRKPQQRCLYPQMSTDLSEHLTLSHKLFKEIQN